MKTGKLFTIDVEIAERLQNLNASALVNGLLKEYFELRSDKNTLKEEKTAVLKSIVKKKSNFLRRLKLLKLGMSSVWITFRKNGFRRAIWYLHNLRSTRTFRGEESLRTLNLLNWRSNY